MVNPSSREPMECARTGPGTLIAPAPRTFGLGLEWQATRQNRMSRSAVNCAFGGTQLRDLYLSGFGGVHDSHEISGVPAQPPSQWPDSQSSRPSVQVPEGVSPMLDLTYAEYGPRKMLADLFIPKGKGPYPAALIIHGGGWIRGNKWFRAMGLEMAKRGFVSMAIDYRLAEEALSSQYP